MSDEFSSHCSADVLVPHAFGTERLPNTIGCQPLRAVVIIEMIDEDGQVSLYVKRDSDAPSWSHLGMLASAQNLITQTDNRNWLMAQHPSSLPAPDDDDE